ncbi:unnamed protein product, partial [Vitis vinifera]
MCLDRPVGKHTPFSTQHWCLGFILFSKLNEKYCGNSFSSLSSLPISTTKVGRGRWGYGREFWGFGGFGWDGD